MKIGLRECLIVKKKKFNYFFLPMRSLFFQSRMRQEVFFNFNRNSYQEYNSRLLLGQKWTASTASQKTTFLSSFPLFQCRLYNFNLQSWNSGLTPKFSCPCFCRYSTLIVLVQKNIPSNSNHTWQSKKNIPLCIQDYTSMQKGSNV